MVLKNKVGLSYTQDFQIFVVVYVPTSVWDKVYELQNGTLEYQTPVKMSKKLKIQDVASNTTTQLPRKHLMMLSIIVIT